ncbi:FHA domain-containing protein [Leucobacter zeae]|nr:FHA domain-containing protein [Leucobacter zeae]
MYNDVSGSGAVGAMMAVIGVWSLVGLAVYVWYLWTLSRLFPLLGLPGNWGWIPVWNQWQLLQRGGMPGWMVLLGFVPGLAIVVLVVSIIAIHRINGEFGKSAGFTVLGAVLPPVWAMLLKNHIDDAQYSGGAHWPAGSPVARATQSAGAQHGAETAGQPGFAAPPAFAAPAHAAPGPDAGFAPPQSARPGIDGAPQPQFAAPEPAQPVMWRGLPPVPDMNPDAPIAGEVSYATAQPQFTPPETPASSMPPAPAFAPPVAPAQQPTFAPPVPAQPQADPRGAAPTGQQHPAAPAAPGSAPGAAPAGAGANEWGFSNTTEDEYERLAAEQNPERAAQRFGHHEPPRPYAWPEPTQDPQPLDRDEVAQYRAEAADDSSRAESPLVLPDASAPARSAEEAPASAAASSPAQQAQAPTAPPVASTGPTIFDRPGDAPAAPAAPVPAAVPAPAAAPVPGPAAPADGTADEDDDRTIVVARRPKWGLELPSGDVVELIGDDVIVGRKPTAQPGTAAVQIPDPTRTLSKSHARMRRTGDSWSIEDLHSTNGVAVVDASGEVQEIAPGTESEASERLVIGTLEVRLHRID